MGFHILESSLGFKKKGHLIRLETCQVNQIASVFFHMNFFQFLFLMYLPFGKLCKKLLDVKCITLNSSLISRSSLAQQINTYLIIIKIYKSQHC